MDDTYSAEKIKQIMVDAGRRHGVTQADVAEYMGWMKQQYWDKLRRGSLRACEMFTILEHIGYRVDIVDSTALPTVENHVRGFGERAYSNISGSEVDSYAMNAVSSEFYKDLEHPFTNDVARELYVGGDKYWMLTYHKGKSVDVETVSGKEAADFIRENGSIEERRKQLEDASKIV